MKQFLRETARYTFWGIVIWIITRSFFFQVVNIPSASMRSTLDEGDYVLVNKLAYGPRLPFTPLSLPFGSGRYFLTWIQLPYLRIPGYSSIRRHDVLVFNLPSQDSLPVDIKTPYIKRCLAVPGDTLWIDGADIFVNGSLLPDPEGVIKKKEMKDAYSPVFFPHDPGIKWSLNKFGPLTIPKKGSLVRLDLASLSLYNRLITVYEKRKLEIKADSIFIDGSYAPWYAFQKDYYFVLGDNRNESIDSRYWGFVPEDHIIGKASLRLFSGKYGFSYFIH